MSKRKQPRDSAVIDARHNFTESDLSKFGGEIATLINDKTHKEKQKKEIASMYKAEIEAIESKMDDLSRKVTNGYEMRTTPCWVEYNFSTGKKQYYRKSDGMLVDERSMSENDYQTKINFEVVEDSEDSEDESIDTETKLLPPSPDEPNEP